MQFCIYCGYKNNIIYNIPTHMNTHTCIAVTEIKSCDNNIGVCAYTRYAVTAVYDLYIESRPDGYISLGPDVTWE